MKMKHPKDALVRELKEETHLRASDNQALLKLVPKSIQPTAPLPMLTLYTSTQVLPRTLCNAVPT